MLLNDEEVNARLESPLNLINRLRAAREIKTTIPSLPPAAMDIVEGLEDKIKTVTLSRKAQSLADSAIEELSTRLSEVKAEKLASVARDMSTVVSNIRGGDKGNTSNTQVIVYAPQILNAELFETIHVND